LYKFFNLSNEGLQLVIE